MAQGRSVDEAHKLDVDGPYATLKEQRAAEQRWIAAAATSSDPKARLFAALQPWIKAQLRKKWLRGPLKDWDSQPSLVGAGLLQQFNALLWEAIIEWDEECSKRPDFEVKPTGVVIVKTTAKIRQWYRSEKERYWSERTAIMGDSLEGSIQGQVEQLRRRAQGDPDPEERRTAQEALKIAKKVGTAESDPKEKTRRRVQSYRAKARPEDTPIEKLKRMSLSTEQAYFMLETLYTRPTRIPREDASRVLLAVPGVKPLWDAYLKRVGGYEGIRSNAEHDALEERLSDRGWTALSELGYEYPDEVD